MPGYLGQHLYKSNQSQRRFILPRWIVFDRASLLRSFFFCARSTLFSSLPLVCYADANSEEQRLIAPSRQRTNTNEQEKKASSFIRFGRHHTHTVRARLSGKSLRRLNSASIESNSGTIIAALRSLLPLLLLLPLFVHVLKEDREAAAVSSRPKSSPEPPSFLLLNCFLPLLPPLPLTTSPSAEETVVSLSLPINTSRSLPRSDSRFKSLQMQRKEESRLPLSLWPACWPGQGPTRRAAARRRSFQDAVSRHVIDASQPDFKLWPPLDPPLPLAEPPPSSLKRKPGFKFHSQRVCSRKEAGIG